MASFEEGSVVAVIGDLYGSLAAAHHGIRERITVYYLTESAGLSEAQAAATVHGVDSRSVL
jgi:hypothetical protein